MKCPKCSTIQADCNDQCSRCGVSLKEYKAAKELNSLAPPIRTKEKSGAGSDLSKELVKYAAMAVGFYFGYHLSFSIFHPSERSPKIAAKSQSNASNVDKNTVVHSSPLGVDALFVKCLANSKRGGASESAAIDNCGETPD